MPPTLKQCATTAITAVHAAFTMFIMDAMLGLRMAQLKMPRLDAYEPAGLTAPAVAGTVERVVSGVIGRGRKSPESHSENSFVDQLLGGSDLRGFTRAPRL
jgi:hypothetical protein